MADKFSAIRSFWGSNLEPISPILIEQFNLDEDTVEFLCRVGLPGELSMLDNAIEINFYFDDRIAKTEYRGKNYCVIGDDSGTYLAISLSNGQVYFIDLDGITANGSVCFVNSGIRKFIETIQVFAEFQQLAIDGNETEDELVTAMKMRMTAIDAGCVEKETWWSAIIDNSI